ncbi:MAG: hypothetical protein IIB55_09865 [Planctomycetes bacterium]|nr:hypothetical protein [Planctomycetota bacterium]
MIRPTDPPVAPLLVSKSDAARMLALSERMIDKLVEARELSRVRFGSARGVRFRVCELEALIEDRTERAGAGDGQARDRAGRFRKEG